MFIGGLSWQTSPGKCATYSVMCNVMYIWIMYISVCTSTCDAILAQSSLMCEMMAGVITAIGVISADKLALNVCAYRSLQIVFGNNVKNIRNA